MRAHVISFLALLAAGILSGCIKESGGKEDEVPPPAPPSLEGTVTLTATLEASQGSKADISPSDGQLTWAAEDTIGVYTSDGKFTPFPLDPASVGKSSGTFTATLPAGVAVSPEGVALFPYHPEDRFNPSGGEVTCHLPSSHQWQQSWSNAAKPPMLARFTIGDTLPFRQTGGIIRVPITNMARSARKFRLLTEGLRISGAFTFNIHDEHPRIAAQPISGQGEAAATFPAPESNATSWVFNLPLPVGDYSSLEIRLDNAEDKSLYAQVSPDKKQVTRATCLQWPQTDVNIPLESFEAGFVSEFSSTNTYGNDPIYTIADNPSRSGINCSAKVLKIQLAKGSWKTSGAFSYSTSISCFGENFRSGGVAFRCKVFYPSAADVNAYYLYVKPANSTGAPAGMPTKIDGEAFDGTALSWASLLTPGVWHTVEYSFPTGSLGMLSFRPFADIHNQTTDSGGRLLYFDDFELVKGSPDTATPHVVPARKNKNSSWSNYNAVTLDRLEGYDPGATDPETDAYGGWKVAQLGATGFFRVQQYGGRWWLVTPEGHPFIGKGVCVFDVSQAQALSAGFSSRLDWATKESRRLQEAGFNSFGAWSAVATLREVERDRRMPYTVIIRPMHEYNKVARQAWQNASFGWEGYPEDFAFVFDDGFDSFVESELKKAALYREDPYCLGYFIDNELPWKDYALERCLTRFPAHNINHIQAQQWLDKRKGKSGATLAEATQEDRRAFIAYCLEVYLEKVTAALRQHDANHLFLGCRFNQWDHELSNSLLFEVAGRHMDVISVNHYNRWQPDQTAMANWLSWSGKPFLVTEFYIKGEDAENSQVGNTAGAGWLVQSQTQRGYFYQNFVLELLKSKSCVGWQWFTYMDHTNDTSVPSPYSNKGIVDLDFVTYTDLLDQMAAINRQVYRLTGFLDKQ